MLGHPPGRLKIASSHRVVQPIENFKLRVKIVQQKSLLAELFDAEGETRDPNFLQTEERVFTWQTKVFSRFEAVHYRDEKNSVTDAQKYYRSILVDSDDQGSRLFCYTQDDHYRPWGRNVCHVTGSYRSPLAARNDNALPTVQNRKPFTERYNKRVVDECPTETRVRSSHCVYRDRRSMYIVADLSSKDEPLGSSSASEILLCTVTYDKNAGTLTIDPDFTNDDCYSVEALGMGYDYWIEHASELPTDDDTQRQKEILRQEIQEKRACREAEIFDEIALSPANVLRVVLNVELTSAHGFPYDALYLTYQVELPKHWSTRDRERLTGRTQRCRMTKGDAHFSYVTEIVVEFDLNCLNDERVQPSWPYLLLSAASLDGWTRYRIEGYASVPLPPSPGRHSYELRTWRPVSGFVNSLRRFFTGGTAELEDVTYCGIPETHEGSRLEKTRLKVVPSGIIKINLNVAHQSKIFMKNRGFRRDAVQRLSAGTLMNSLDNVLEQFKAARERMLQARAMNL